MTMMEKSFDQRGFTEILNLLQFLKYDDDECEDTEWTKFMLLTPCEARTKLLLWILKQLCPDEAAEVEICDQRNFVQKTFQLLYHQGLCKNTDIKIIEGNSNETSQLKFWLLCLESIKQLRNFSSHKTCIMASSEIDSTLDNIAQSPYVSSLAKETSINIIPGDYVKRYKEWCKQGSSLALDEQLCEAELQLKESLNNIDTTASKYKVNWNHDEHNDLINQNCEATNDLSTQIKLFNDVYSSYISPWTTTSPQLELQNTGSIVEDVNQKLSSLEQKLECRHVVLKDSIEIQDNQPSVDNHSNTITTTLHTLASYST